MKILKIFGIVVGIHVFALILIFANPGCSSTAKPAPAPSDTVAPPAAPPVINAPSAPGSVYSSTTDTASSAPAISFNPEAPAAAAGAAGGGSRVMPTRPGTPVAGVLVAEPVSDVTPAASYTVKNGDNLWTIAKKNNLTVAQLTAANSLSANANLRPGQKIVIPGPAISSSTSAPTSVGTASAAKSVDALAAAAARAGGEGIKHTVKSGETLGAIARKYEVRQRDLAVANNISDPGKLKPGMELTIPGWKSPAGGAGKSTPKAGTSAAKTPKPAPAPVSEPPPVVEPVPAPTTLAPVPVIRIDGAASTPAPK